MREGRREREKGEGEGGREGEGEGERERECVCVRERERETDNNVGVRACVSERVSKCVCMIMYTIHIICRTVYVFISYHVYNYI